MELMEDLDPEEARAVVDLALKLMMDAVHRYDGYIVQLQNEIGRAVAIVRSDETITPDHLSPNLRSAASSRLRINAAAPESVEDGESRHSAARPPREARADFEARYLAEILAENAGPGGCPSRERLKRVEWKTSGLLKRSPRKCLRGSGIHVPNLDQLPLAAAFRERTGNGPSRLALAC